MTSDVGLDIHLQPDSAIDWTASSSLASSSRSQVHKSVSRFYPQAGLLGVSTVVHGSPQTNVAIVTQLVTQAAKKIFTLSAGGRWSASSTGPILGRGGWGVCGTVWI